MRHVVKVLCLLLVLLVAAGGCATDLSGRGKPKIDLTALESPIILKGDEKSAFRDPAAIYHDGVFYMYYTCWFHEDDGVAYSYTAMSKSRDLANWTEPKIITPRDINLNFSSPGNVIRFGDEWILCLQTYPTPGGRKHGNHNCRVYIMRSKDLENWGLAEILMVKGPDVAVKDMGRLIDAYLVEDKDEPGKWWCFFDDNAVNMSWSYDLKTWNYLGRVPGGENACVLVEDDEYILFHSPGNGIGIKRSKDMTNWKDWGEVITLGQENWDWAKQRLTAGFVLDMRSEPAVGKYLMFYHAEPPGGFKKYASLGIAWSDDLVTWDWPGK
ncbi:MAG: glycoside hydrolase family protein [Planctomycetota bacterium]|jgi:hypothetical protein